MFARKSPDPSSSSRREFFTGISARRYVAPGVERIADRLAEPVERSAVPTGGDTVRLTTRAMACEFTVIMNPGSHEGMMQASDALDLVHTLDHEMTVYREDSALSRINRAAAGRDVPVEARLFELLNGCRDLCHATHGAFDPTSGPLIALWQRCRDEGRIPTQEQIEACLEVTGMQHVRLDAEAKTIRFDRDGTELNLGGIGKGYALDQVRQCLVESGGPDAWLVHGGHSSLLARGEHNATGGWPVGIGNPLFTDRRLGTILLRDQAMATSGSNVQFFRQGGRRYGHILDPRTGWPVEGILSVSVVAADAATADALSTAFFVLGVENTRRCCDNLGDVGAVVIPFPQRGRLVQPVVMGIPDEQLFWDTDQVVQSC